MNDILILLAQTDGTDVFPWVQTGAVTVCTGLLVWLITQHLPKRDKEARDERQSLLDGAKTDRAEFRAALHDVTTTLATQIKEDNAANRATTGELTREFHQLRLTLQEDHAGPRGAIPSDKA